MSTTPSPNVVLYDGHCSFCVAQSRRLLRLARPGSIRLVDFQQPGALAEFPFLSHDQCMTAMHLVAADGRIHRGVGAIVAALATRLPLRWLPWAYRLPGVKHLCDWVYGRIAARRYRHGMTCANGRCKMSS